MVGMKDRAFSVTVGENIRHIRLQRGLSEKEVADFIKTNPRYYREIEKGAHALSVDTLELISFALGVDVTLLVDTKAVQRYRGETREGRLLERYGSEFDRYPFRIQQTILRLLDLFFTLCEQVCPAENAVDVSIDLLERETVCIHRRPLWEVTENYIVGEDNYVYKSYGIAVYRLDKGRKRLLDCLADISPCREAVVELANLLQLSDPSVEHFREIVQNFAERDYTIGESV